jgi:hypothetical protein
MVRSFTNKRTYERCRYCVPIVFSYFNKNHLVNSQTINCGSGGIGIKSRIFLQPGATVYIRIKQYLPNDAGKGDSQGLCSVALAEIKWCKEIFNEAETFYEIGARYCAPGY